MYATAHVRTRTLLRIHTCMLPRMRTRTAAARGDPGPSH
ncbi:unnamed protein product, partial [Staurois parvus]